MQIHSFGDYGVGHMVILLLGKAAGTIGIIGHIIIERWEVKISLAIHNST